MASTKPKALLLGTVDHGPARKEWEALSQYAELVSPKSNNRSDFIAECKSGALDGTVAIYRTFGSASITGIFDEELLSALPKSVKFVCHNGAGYDSIDVPACTKHGIHVSNVPKAVDNATADTAVFLIISTLRNYPQSMAALRKGQWRGEDGKGLGLTPLGHDPQGKVLGILGMGGIGRNLATKMRAFGMTTIYHNRNKLSAQDEDGAKYVSFEELLKTSDVLSLNLPLNPKTKHTISSKEFDLMKPTAIVVNTARGGVMDEDALVKALDAGKIAGAGLDVYEDEPKIHPGLVANEKATLLPHMGTWTVETQTDMEKWNIDNVRSALTTGELKSRVPEQTNEAY